MTQLQSALRRLFYRRDSLMALMGGIQLGQTRRRVLCISLFVFGVCCALFSGHETFAQTDQGTITGVVTDATGAVIPGAKVTLANTDTGLILHGNTDGSGIYVFSPIKIGNYKVSATAPGFETTLQRNLTLHLQERLNVVISLKPGSVSETVIVSTLPPLLQLQSATVGQVISTETINNTPLNGRNWVYIAQEAAGVTPATSTQGSSGASRGFGTGDFFANGQRATQNNFILDGVDNNVNVDDFMNGASYNVRPPPDALAEFSVVTTDYDAELGHSAGGIVNASIKSGTNKVHGDVWEYYRNAALDATDWSAVTTPPYNENQFGATLGFPIRRDKLFYFGDAEANRITIGQPIVLTVPTALTREGNFTELLNPSLTGKARPIQLYEPNSGGTALLSCNGQNNVLCASQVDSVAKNLLALAPSPNTNGGAVYNNYKTNFASNDDTWQWDQRMDWNISAKDQSYARYSYSHEQVYNVPPLGPILYGAASLGIFQGTNDTNMSQSLMISETHLLSSSLTNEFRFGYNWGNFSFYQADYNTNVAAQEGLGGVPFGPGSPDNGGIPGIVASGLSRIGVHCCLPSHETQNSFQVLDNVTTIKGNHTLKFGVSFQPIRLYFDQPGYGRGVYNYTGLFTSDLGASYTGSGVADFLTNQMDSGSISPNVPADNYRWNRAAYAQDDWRVNKKLTLNLGVRYEYYSPYMNSAGHLSNFIVAPPLGGIGTGTGILELPAKIQSQNVLPPIFLNQLAADNITVRYVDNPSLVSAQKTNFAPRFGFAYPITPSTVIRGGFGMFYGGLESIGGTDPTINYPWNFSAGVTAPNCAPNNCLSDGITLENGFSTQLSTGLQNFVSYVGFNSSDTRIKTPYTMGYNLTVERALSRNLVATVGYVGNVSRHMDTGLTPNAADALENPANNPQYAQPFPDFGEVLQESFSGDGMYNGLQAKVEKRLANGLDFLATYTWSHAMDDSYNTGGIEAGTTTRNTNLIPLIDEYTSSSIDVRDRFTFNGFYQLPFGKGRAFIHSGGWRDYVAGGWATSLTFNAQTGSPFTVSPDISTAAGGNANAILIRNPFAGGGTPDPSNPGVTCARTTRNVVNWYNPCAFANPLPGDQIPASGSGSQVTGLANVIAYLGGKSNQVYGPGYERVNMSLFKNLMTWREEFLQLRADAFNLLNHPSLGAPSITTDDSNGGAITSPQIFQNHTPDARFFQLSLKYVF